LILAVPRFVARRILAPLRQMADGFTYSSWVVANLHLRRRPRSVGFPGAWDNVLYDSPSLGYVVATHQTLVDRGPTVWTHYLPLADADPAKARIRLQGQDHSTLSDAVLADLSRAHEDLESTVDRIDVWRWGHAMVRPTPGFIWSSPRRGAAAQMQRVHFAHADLSGVPLLEEAVYHGVRAAEEVAIALGRPCATLLR
jgi:protoporphyrinogen oxidase